MAESHRDEVWKRAEGRCEYCHIPQDLDVQPFQLDHIRPRKHGGATTLDNLALACLPCNAYKGPNAGGFDPETNALVALFNPRTDDWKQHFEWQSAALVGKTPVGRATIEVLRINAPERIAHRHLLIATGAFHP